MDFLKLLGMAGSRANGSADCYRSLSATSSSSCTGMSISEKSKSIDKKTSSKLDTLNVIRTIGKFSRVVDSLFGFNFGHPREGILAT